MRTTMTNLKNVHPGEILEEEFLRPLNLSQTKAALAMRVSPRRINEIVLGRRSITADTALRLSRFFNTSEQFWMSLQDDFDLEKAKCKSSNKIFQTVTPYNLKK